MPTTRIRSLSIKGFRAYGATEQTLNLPSDIAAVWGPNSKGKTSLAEAVEFLLTGRIARRELMASGQDEFADALRNAHLPSGQDVYVAAQLVAQDGSIHEIKRTLLSDYAKKQDCHSRLDVDGEATDESALKTLGILLSQPPLEAPVLAQHTLGYIFSVRPQDRSTYFKALLEVSDLDNLRNDIFDQSAEVAAPSLPRLPKFDTATTVPALKPVLLGVAATIPGTAALKSKLGDAAVSLIASVGEADPGADKRLPRIKAILDERRSKSFPVALFNRVALGPWNRPSEIAWKALDLYLAERSKVDDETSRLVTLFEAALKLPSVAGLEKSIECPLCGVATGLTPERLQHIRDHVAGAASFKRAEATARTTLSQMSSACQLAGKAIEAARPAFLNQPPAKRRTSGFTIARLSALLGDKGPELTAPWLKHMRKVALSARRAGRAATAAKSIVDDHAAAMSTRLDPPALRAAMDALDAGHSALSAALEEYVAVDGSLRTALNQALDTRSDAAGWQAFLDITADINGLRKALIERRARATVRQELETALKQIDTAKEAVLDDKFSDHSDLIHEWWERLRPDEATFFSAVQPRKGAKRTIDFKAGLSPNPDRSAPKMRDVIAIFSQSQLHCLGLSLFLARAQYEGVGFIVLDDPVLSSDEDYRVHFNTSVLTALLALPMQVIVITQDHTTWKELEMRYRHVAISTAQLYVDSPASGTVIENTSDALLAKLSRASSLARGGHPDSRKECGVQLRDGGERFGKEMLVTERLAKGEATAALADYDGKMMEWLFPRVEPLLTKDASHPGKLEAFRATVNRACHDNSPPSSGEMTQACGEIGYLVKQYLGR